MNLTVLDQKQLFWQIHPVYNLLLQRVIVVCLGLTTLPLLTLQAC